MKAIVLTCESIFTSLRDGNRPHRMEGDNISTEHSPGSDPLPVMLLVL